MARLHLLLTSFRRLDALPSDLQQEIRAQIGWTQNETELHQQPGERDHWQVLGQRETVADRLRVRRIWLRIAPTVLALHESFPLWRCCRAAWGCKWSRDTAVAKSVDKLTRTW
jgi:hypothetical protein